MMYLPQVCIPTQPVLFPTSASLSHTGDGEAVRQRDGVSNGEALDRQPQILLIGDHPTLQYSRRKVLESAGYAVASARSNVVVEELFLRGIELVLLCHTIPDDVATQIVASFRRLSPQIPVLQISLLENSYGDRGKVRTVPSRPVEMLRAIAAKLHA